MSGARVATASAATCRIRKAATLGTIEKDTMLPVATLARAAVAMVGGNGFVRNSAV